MRSSIGESGALLHMTIVVSNNATWDENYYFQQAGVGMQISNLSFQLQFRRCPDATTSDLVLSTAEGQLTIIEDDGGNETILRVNVPYTTISGMCGDYIVDLVSKDPDEKLTHWAHGTATFRQSPVSF